MPAPKYEYERKATDLKTAGGKLASESLRGVVEMWVAEVIKVVGDAIPSHLKVDGLAWAPMRRGYVSVEGKGYSKSDFEATTTVAISFYPTEVSVFFWYKDVMMKGEDTLDFKMGWDDHPSVITQKLEHFLTRR